MINRRAELSRLVAFLTVVAAFCFATWMTEDSLARIDEASDQLASNSAPSIEHLAAVRGEVRQVESLLRDYLEAKAQGRPADRGGIDASLGRVDQNLRVYLALPTFQGEQAYWERLHQAQGRFTAAVERVLAQLDLGATPQAQTSLHREVFSAGLELVDAALTAIDFNAANGHALALQIKQSRIRSRRLAVGLDLLCVAYTTGAALWFRRQGQRNRALQAEQDRLREERARELEWFAGRLAHDILDPLSATRMALELMEAAPSGERRQALQAQVLQGLERTGDIVGGLLAFARSGGQPEPGAWCDAARVIENEVAELQPQARAAGVDLGVEAIAPCLAGCSPGLLRSLVSNLVRNAIKYLGDRPVRSVRVRCLSRGPRLRVEVEDTGPGLAEHLREAVFEPYLRATQGPAGLGLGLATVKRLAEGCGGSAGVQSALGVGSVFWFELPQA